MARLIVIAALALVSACADEEDKGGEGEVGRAEGEGEDAGEQGAGGGGQAGGPVVPVEGEGEGPPPGPGEGDDDPPGEEGEGEGPPLLPGAGVVSNPDFSEGGAPCEVDSECRSSVCVDGFCDEPLCDRLAERNECGGGRVCAALVSDDRCWVACTGPNDCPEEHWCQPVVPNMGRCWPRGREGAGGPCQTAADCESGLCDRGLCSARCDGQVGQPGACDPGHACVRLMHGDVCRGVGGAAAGARCQEHGGCASGFCWKSVCRDTCGGDRACANGRVCRSAGAARICLDPCADADRCPEGQACAPFFDGMACREAGALGPMEPCRRDMDCASAVCSAGQCAPPCDGEGLGPEACQGDGRSCVAHAQGRVCVPSGPAAAREPATGGEECTSGVVTSGGRCTPSCTTTESCGPAYSCVRTTTTQRFGGRPLLYCERGCATSEECPGWPAATFCDRRTDVEGAPVAVCSWRGWGGLGDGCLSNADCISGLCHRGACLAECGPAADCAPGARSGGTAGAVCVDGVGPGDPAVSLCLLPCADVAECPSGHACVQGQCRPLLDGDVGPSLGDPCFGPSACASGRCVDGYCEGACEAGACPEGQVCLPGRDVCRPSCATHDDCPGRGECARGEEELPHCVR